MPSKLLSALLGIGLAAVLAPTPPAAARPGYFQTFTTTYGLVPGQDLYACGVCHRLWTGTGARNPFGVAVEQQLYIGKTVSDALLTLESQDTDGDGFTNLDEITVHGTLPGYSCSTYELATNPPANFQSLITPGVPTCLQPIDIKVTPTSVAVLAELTKTTHTIVEVRNNGSEQPIQLTGVTLLAGSSPTLQIAAPATPVSIPLGGSVAVDVAFSPTVSGLVTGTLRISSDDPDEADIDVPLSGIGFVRVLAPAPARAACQKSLEREVERYSKSAFREWMRCYLDELGGRACDTGRRDQRLARAEVKLRARVGGTADRVCGGAGLTPSRLGMPSTCGGTCGAVSLGTMASVADCLACRQDAARDALLQSVIGTTPPDLPLNRPGSDALHCNQLLGRLAIRGVGRLQKLRGACALGNVTASAPVDCAAELASKLSREADMVNAGVGICADSAALLACPFLPSADPACLGASASSIAADLVDAVFPPL